MTDRVVPTYTIQANLRWFAAAYAVVGAVLTGAMFVAYYLWPNLNIPSTGISLGAYIGVVYAAGMRFKQQNAGQWTPRDRNWLALGYAVASVLVSSVIVAAVAPFDLGTREAIALVASDGVLAIAVAIPLTLLVFGAAARLSLAMVARQRWKRP